MECRPSPGAQGGNKDIGIKHNSGCIHYGIVYDIILDGKVPTDSMLTSEPEQGTPREEEIMSDLQAYISRRRSKDAAFDEGFEAGYNAFRIGALLRQIREESGLTQAEMAERLHTQIVTSGTKPRRVVTL